MTHPKNVRPDTYRNPARVRKLSALPDPTRPDPYLLGWPSPTGGTQFLVTSYPSSNPNGTQANARARRRLELR